MGDGDADSEWVEARALQKALRTQDGPAAKDGVAQSGHSASPHRPDPEPSARPGPPQGAVRGAGGAAAALRALAARAQPCACAGPWVSAAPQDAAVHAALAARGALILRVTDFHRPWDRGERHNPQKETERRNQTRVSRDFSCILFVAATFLLGWPVVVL